MCNNLHITLTPFCHESRLLKETASLVHSGLAKHVYIVALHEDGLSEHEVIDNGRTVWRVPLRSRSWPRKLISQMAKYTEFCIRVIRYSHKKSIGMINIHHYSLLPLGVLLKVICRAKLIYDTHELETEIYGLCGTRKVFARYLESAFIKLADLVIVVGDGINKWYRDRYGLSNIVTVLNAPAYQDISRASKLRKDLGISEEKRIVIYQGGLSTGRGIEELLEIFAREDDHRHVLVIMGCGELKSLILSYCDNHENIYFHGAVAPAEVLNYTASADVGISYITGTCLSYNMCMPNKLFEYIMARIPVIANNATEMGRYVKENEIGAVIDELNSHSLDNALKVIERMNSNELRGNLRRVAKLCSWDSQEKNMIRAYRQYVFK